MTYFFGSIHLCIGFERCETWYSSMQEPAPLPEGDKEYNYMEVARYLYVVWFLQHPKI
jgi:hypothetical protein